MRGGYITIKEVYDSIIEVETIINSIKQDMRLKNYSKLKTRLNMAIGILQGTKQSLNNMRGFK